MHPTVTPMIPRVDRQAITSHLSRLEGDDALQAARDVEDLMEHPGWDRFRESVDLYARDTMQRLATTVSDNPAKYAALGGEIQGLQRLDALASGVVVHGRTVAERLRANQNEAIEEIAA